MLINCQFWHTAVFPRCNNLMGCVASRLFLYRSGYPVFRYVPKVALIWGWGHGIEKSPRGYTLDESHEEDGRLGVDWTAYYDTIMYLMLEHVRGMEKTLAGRKAADDSLVARLPELPGINRRQLEVLRRAIVDPGQEFRVSWHQAEFGVVYSTARSDLERLAEMGLLSRSMASQAYVYRAAPALPSRIEELAARQRRAR